MRARVLWKPHEDLLLRDLASKGLNSGEMSVVLGRNNGSIRGRARKLGVNMNRRGRHHTPLEGDATTWDRAERLCAFANVPLPLARYVVDVADTRGLQLSELRSESRTAELVRIRANIARRARANGYTLSAIGRAINRDHTTVLHFVKQELVAA